MTFKPVPGYEGRYSVSDDGRVFSHLRNRELKPKIDRYGYKVVALFKDGKAHHLTVHRIVAMAFIPNPFSKGCVNHINEVKTDNRAENLEWATVKENDNHGTRNSRMSDTKSRKPVMQISPDGTIRYFKGVKDASRQTGINRSHISDCCKGLRRTAGYSEWRYVNE
jgi:hypothetical protein